MGNPLFRTKSVDRLRSDAEYSYGLKRTLGAWDFAPNPFWYKIYSEIIPRMLDIMRSRGKAKTKQSLGA